MRSNSKIRRVARAKRKVRVRKKLHGTAARPRLSVFRSHRFIYVQVVDDDAGCTLMTVDSHKPLETEVPEGLSTKCAEAYKVGKVLAEQAKEKGFGEVIFDRSGYLYHGRVAALARGARDGGLKF